MASPVVIVSNRLPISVKKSRAKLEFYASVGGLATGLAAYVDDKRNKWIGWPGIPSDELTKPEREQIAVELRKSNCYPVFLTQNNWTIFITVTATLSFGRSSTTCQPDWRITISSGKPTGQSIPHSPV